MPTLLELVVFWDFGGTLVEIKQAIYQKWARYIASARECDLNSFADLSRAVSELRQAIRDEWKSREHENFQWVRNKEDEHKALIFKWRKKLKIEFSLK